MNLTQRQQDILFAIIDAYSQGCPSVGSNMLVQNYDLGVSSATVRNEMVDLMRAGLLEKSYASAGRIPTDLAFRYFVNQKLDNAVLDSVRLVQIRQGIYKVRFEQDRLIKTILQILSDISEVASFVMVDDMLHYHGVSNLMKYEELRSVEQLQRLLEVLEDENLLPNLLSEFASNSEQVKLLIGGEIGIQDMDDFVVLFTQAPFMAGQVSTIGLIGPRRLDYEVAVPALEVMQEALDEGTRHWQ